MRKFLLLMLVCVMCFGMCACGVEVDDNSVEMDNSIELTSLNYEQYLNVSVGQSSYGDGDRYYNSVTYVDFGYFFDGVEFELTVQGASDNYNYSDVVVKVKVSGEYAGMSRDYSGDLDLMDSTSFSFDMTAVANVAGDGSDSYIFKAPSPYKINKDKYMVSSYDIVSVSGKVTPV